MADLMSAAGPGPGVPGPVRWRLRWSRGGAAPGPAAAGANPPRLPARPRPALPGARTVHSAGRQALADHQGHPQSSGSSGSPDRLGHWHWDIAVFQSILVKRAGWTESSSAA